MQRTAAKLLLAAALVLPQAALASDLLGVYHQALESDPQLRAAEAAHRAAMEIRPQSRSALLPQVNLSAERNTIDSDITGLGNRNYDTNGYTLSLVQSIYHHDTYVQLRQADAGIAQADAELRAAGHGLILRVAEAYFNLLAAEDNLEFAEAEKRAISQQLRQTKQRFEVGLSAITDVHEAQASHDLAVAQEIAAQNQLEIAREVLRELTGNEPDGTAPLSGEMALVGPEPADIDQWVETALQQNLGLLATEASVNAAREEVKRRQSGHYPSLDLVASRRYSDTRDAPSFGNESTTNTIGLQLNVPLYSGGRTSATVREAGHRLTQALEGLDQQRRATVRQTRSAYLGVIAGISRVKALKQSLSSTQTALEATQAGFEVGTRTVVDVLNSQRLVYLARRDYARARYDYLLATLSLKQAAGTLDVADLESINRWFQ